MLSFLFGLTQPVDRVRYAVTGVALMLVKYLLDAGSVYLVAHRFFSPLTYLQPVYTLRYEGLQQHEGLVLAMLVWTLPFLWIGVAFSLRRALDAGLSPWLALLFFVPAANYVFMAVMCFLPSRPVTSRAEPPPGPSPHLRHALLGTAGAVLLGLAMTGVSVYALGRYGASLFFGTPFLMGVFSAYLYNRERPRSLRATLAVGLTSVVLSGLALLLFAVEGVLCIAMAVPLAALVALLGSAVGWALTQRAPGSGGAVAIALLTLPLLAWTEPVERVPPLHEVVTVVEINAPPERVFPNVVGFSDLPPPGAWWFGRGVAHPRRARIEGTGVGAVRYCEFSTGPFVEPITAWEAPSRLAFDVTAQPPPMEEWSFYGHIDAPHLDGYLRSRRGEFRLTPLPGGRTRLEGHTWYELDIHPQVYWTLWSNALIHSIHSEVLDHVRTLSEAPEAR